MAITKKEEKEIISPMQPVKPKLPFFKRAWLPMLIIIICLVLAMFLEIGRSIVYEFPEKIMIGVPYSYNFSNELIPLTEVSSSLTHSDYIFYLGSRAGFPPEGLILNSNGILNGTPMVESGKFEICVKEGNWAKCKIFRLNVTFVENT